MDHPFFSISGYLFGVLGVILAVVFYYRSRIVKQLSFFVTNLEVIKSVHREISDLSVYYKQDKIENLTVSEVYVWNSGNATIDQGDLTEMEKPSILSVDGRVLEASITSMANSSEGWKLEVREDKVELKFDFVRPKNGVVLRVVHIGSKAEIVGQLKTSDFKIHAFLPSPYEDINYTGLLVFVICGVICFWLLFYFWRSSWLAAGLSLFLGGAILVLLSILSGYFKRANKITFKPSGNARKN